MKYDFKKATEELNFLNFESVENITRRDQSILISFWGLEINFVLVHTGKTND